MSDVEPLQIMFVFLIFYLAVSSFINISLVATLVILEMLLIDKVGKAHICLTAGCKELQDMSLPCFCS